MVEGLPLGGESDAKMGRQQEPVSSATSATAGCDEGDPITEFFSWLPSFNIGSAPAICGNLAATERGVTCPCLYRMRGVSGRFLRLQALHGKTKIMILARQGIALPYSS
jgi:hypothetical protein